MRHMYLKSSTMKWDPPSKVQELFHHDSRFLLLKRLDPQEGADTDVHCEPPPIVAYSMFRFEMEDSECVLYCYELQVSKAAQRSGAGRNLMQSMCHIARQWKMRQVVLTVFQENEAAVAFYKNMGFNAVVPEDDTDGSDGEWEDEDKGRGDSVDYWIMSKDI
ncbi:hypothetical protein BC834DRAFT_849034 [Gloeopeniophorella convolvens]|nr:hypothetical protein BC834DRAFT_849034 [Gloeopeniophorella convolvens]